MPYENVVRVEGNVYEPGLIAYETNLTIYKAIIQAGGYMPNSLKKEFTLEVLMVQYIRQIFSEGKS